VIVLNYGQKIADGPAKEVMESDEVKKAYLGSEDIIIESQINIHFFISKRTSEAEK